MGYYSRVPHMTNPEPRGIGGWLILVAMGLAMTTVMGLVTLQVHLPVFTTGAWTALTSPESPAYHAIWAPLLIFIFETGGNLAIVVAAVCALALMKRHSPRFPPLMMWYLGGSALFGFADLLMAAQIPDLGGANTQSAQVGRGIIVAAIWIPYFLKSKRVRNTFLRGRRNRHCCLSLTQPTQLLDSLPRRMP